MRYIAIIDDKDLSEEEKSHLVFEGERPLALKPITIPLFVNTNGESVYLHQKYVDCLVKFAQEEEIADCIRRQFESDAIWGGFSKKAIVMEKEDDGK